MIFRDSQRVHFERLHFEMIQTQIFVKIMGCLPDLPRVGENVVEHLEQLAGLDLQESFRVLVVVSLPPLLHLLLVPGKVTQTHLRYVAKQHYEMAHAIDIVISP